MIGRSRALNVIKHRRVLEMTELSDDISDDRKTLEETVLQTEIQRTVNCALAQLDDDCRLAIHLVYFEGLSYKEAATVMKKTEKQIDNTLQKAKARLRTLLGKEGEQLL